MAHALLSPSLSLLIFISIFIQKMDDTCSLSYSPLEFASCSAQSPISRASGEVLSWSTGSSGLLPSHGGT